jgi:hypothetical protein
MGSKKCMIRKNTNTQSYVYWTMHHLDSWIKIHQLDVTCFIISLFNAQHVLNVSTSILRSLRLICWFISWVVLLRFSLHKDTTPPQPNHTVTPTHIEPEQYSPWNISTNKSQAHDGGCTNIRNMLSGKQWNNKASDIKLVYLYSTNIQSNCHCILLHATV